MFSIVGQFKTPLRTRGYALGLSMARRYNPVTIPLAVGGAYAISAATKPKITQPKAAQPKTMQPVAGEQLTEQDKKNKLMAISMLTKDWNPPKLSQTGMLGY
jgi:hypothetical protein